MKKIRVIALFIIMSLLVGMSVPAFAAKSVKGDIVYTSKKYGFSLKIPASWKGKYVVQEATFPIDGYKGVSFNVYYNNKKQSYPVLTIITSKSKQSIVENPFAKYLGAKKGVYYGYICNAGDADAYLLKHPAVLNMISKMTAEDAPKVAKTFKFIK